MDFASVWDFASLYEAHLAARRGKRNRAEVAAFELDLASNLVKLSDDLRLGTYRPGPYRCFLVREPKLRHVSALPYRDRVVQHSLADNVLEPILEPRLIYDNAACRRGKGTDFALERLCGFLRMHFREHGADGWYLKCDIRHYFDSIDHAKLKRLLRRVPFDRDTRALLDKFVDGFESAPGKGLPLGNQTSQWIALYYLDPLDRLVKEQMGMPYYSRYMDDMVLVHSEKRVLLRCLREMEAWADNAGLAFNGKTQVGPLSNGIDYLGFHLLLTDTGRVVRRLRAQAKRRCRRKVHAVQAGLARGTLAPGVCAACLDGHRAHISKGNTWHLRRSIGF